VLGRIPGNSGIACVVVAHLSPKHESHLDELLQPYTQMRVQQVTETVALEPNHVYVIPPNANLTAIDTHLRLSELEEHRSERTPIDSFLRALAATHDGSAVGVILTGAGSDGALGLRQIKERGGLTIVQDPNEAEYDSMPRAAIATGMVDRVLPVRDVADEILRFCSTEPRLPAHDSDVLDDGQSAAFDEILAQLRLHMGEELAVYRRDSILRRIGKRMQLHHVDTLARYLEILILRPDESPALVNDLQVTVTEFFRDEEAFGVLSRVGLPHLFDVKSRPNERLRAWSIGCSSGEEAYSLAMLMLEEAGRRKTTPQLKIFASDVAENMLSRARDGIYPREIAAQVSAERLERFFTAEHGHYRVRREVRDIVTFTTHHLFVDPPFSHLDLIVCRNLLCDLRPEIGHAVLNLFHYALEPHGMLLFGGRDSIEAPHLFASEDERVRLFCKKDGVRLPLTLPVQVVRNPARRRRDLSPARASLSSAAAIHAHAVERFFPPSVLIDGANRIIHYAAQASRYVRIPGGEPTHELIKLVREPLRSRLRAAIDTVRRDSIKRTTEPFTGLTDDGPRALRLVVEPVQGAPGWLLIIFDELSEERREGERPGSSAPAETVSQLQADLEQTHQRSRDAGAHAAVAELGSILTELDSAKQELQAVNEQLTTVDQENQRRIGELDQLSAGLQQLLESTGIPTLFLDRDLRIVRFTPQLSEIFHVRDLDVGRPFLDVTHDLICEHIASDARRAVEHRVSVEREVSSRHGRWYLMRMLPYHSVSQNEDGAVVTLIDITARKQAEDELRSADRRKDEFIALLAHELRNPLAPISSGIEVLKIAGDDPHLTKQVLTTIERQTGQLVRLVDDLLDISRIRGGKLRLRKSLVNLPDVVRDAVTAVRPLIERAEHELTILLPNELVMLDADHTRLTQVLANLLNNAARYTPKNGRIAVVAERDGDHLVLKVQDNGFGIPEDVLNHVFEMFYQGDDARVSRNTGLGIGLTLAKSLVEMHGGTIGVSSPGADQGSEFKLRLPISKRAVQAARAPDQSEDLSGHRVLIVDDNADAAETLQLLMNTLGSNDVQVAGSGPEALAKAVDLKPDIVLLDLKMPDMDGYEVARRIRREPWGANVLLVALTGWGLEEHKRRSKEAGFDRHLTKPADRATLKAALRHPRASAPQGPLDIRH
jgi:two-component system CheB/CheR fusion protein